MPSLLFPFPHKIFFPQNIPNYFEIQLGNMPSNSMSGSSYSGSSGHANEPSKPDSPKYNYVPESRANYEQRTDNSKTSLFGFKVLFYFTSRSDKHTHCRWPSASRIRWTIMISRGKRAEDATFGMDWRYHGSSRLGFR